MDSDNPVLSDPNEDGISEEESSAADDLRKWVTDHQVKHDAVNDLLKFLQAHGHTELPSTARTPMRTQRVVNVEHKTGMEYVDFNICELLLNILQKYQVDLQDLPRLYL